MAIICRIIYVTPVCPAVPAALTLLYAVNATYITSSHQIQTHASLALPIAISALHPIFVNFVRHTILILMEIACPVHLTVCNAYHPLIALYAKVTSLWFYPPRLEYAPHAPNTVLVAVRIRVINATLDFCYQMVYAFLALFPTVTIA